MAFQNIKDVMKVLQQKQKQVANEHWHFLEFKEDDLVC